MTRAAVSKGGLRRTGGASGRRRAVPGTRPFGRHALESTRRMPYCWRCLRDVARRPCTRTLQGSATTVALRGLADAARPQALNDSCALIRSLCSGRGALSRASDVTAWSNMRMQLTRPRGRWSKAGRLSNASLQLIRVR